MRRSDGALLALFPDKWRAHTAKRDHPEIVLEQLPASGG
jgi:peptide chain release factor 3